MANSRKKRRAKFADVSNILSKVVEGLGLDKRLHEQALFSVWATLVEPACAARSRPIYIDGQYNLVVAVQDSSTAQELSFQKLSLLKKLRQIAPGLGLNIKGIRFDLKRFHEQRNNEEFLPVAQPVLITEHLPDDKELEAVVLDAEDEAQIADLVSSLLRNSEKDLEENTNKLDFSERILNIAGKQLRLKKWYKRQNLPACEKCRDPLLYKEFRLCRYCVQQLRSNTIVEE